MSASVSRVGPLEYRRNDGTTITEWVTSEALFDADSLGTAGTAAVTLGHPPEFVSPDNWKQYAIGATGSTVKARVDDGLVDIVFVVGDREAIDAIERGEATQVSAGYLVEVAENGGRLEQRNRQYNHFALVPRGRAGADVALHLDGADDLAVYTMEDAPTMATKPDPVTKEDAVPTYKGMTMDAQAVDAFKKMEDMVGSLTEKLDKYKAKNDAAEVAALTAERDRLAARVDALTAERDARLDADQISAEVMQRLDTWNLAQPFLEPGTEFDAAMDAQAIKALAVGTAYPALKLDGRSHDYVQGLWEQLQLSKPPDTQRKADSKPNPIETAAASAGTRTDSGSVQRDDDYQARVDAIEASYREASTAYQNAWKKEVV